jgi:hypothetical protein
MKRFHGVEIENEFHINKLFQIKQIVIERIGTKSKRREKNIYKN